MKYQISNTAKLIFLIASLLGMFLILGFTNSSTASKDKTSKNDTLKDNSSNSKKRSGILLDVFGEYKLDRVLEKVSADLGEQGILDIHFSSGKTDSILNSLQKDKNAYDVILLEGIEAVKLALQLKLIKRDGLKTIASDRLVIATKKGLIKTDPLKELTSAKFGDIAISDPDKTTEGVHSEQALKRIGLYKKLSGKLVKTDSQEQVAALVKKDKAKAAILYLSIATQYKLETVITFPKNSYYPLLYFAAVTKNTKKQEAAMSFINYLAGQTSADAWIENGFSPAPEELP